MKKQDCEKLVEQLSQSLSTLQARQVLLEAEEPQIRAQVENELITGVADGAGTHALRENLSNQDILRGAQVSVGKKYADAQDALVEAIRLEAAAVEIEFEKRTWKELAVLVSNIQAARVQLDLIFEHARGHNGASQEGIYLFQKIGVLGPCRDFLRQAKDQIEPLCALQDVKK